MSEILDLIDQAIDDCAVSGDAMRWTPDPVPADKPYPDGPYADLIENLAAQARWLTRDAAFFGVPVPFLRMLWMTDDLRR